MRTQRRLQKISTAISLVGLALGFSVLGLLIVAKEHDGGASIIGGILGILLGAAFLIAACLHWKCGDQIQVRAEEVLAAEIVSEMRQAAGAAGSYRDFSARIPRLSKPSYSGNPPHWMHSMNGRPPFRPDWGLLLWRDP
jgi:hypothetical protein